MTATEKLLARYGVAEPSSGADVRDGWLPLVEALLEKLIALGWDRECLQVKEKYGGLRFYVGAGSDEVHAAIEEAEEASLRACEACGAPGQARGGGWVRTLCDAHAKEEAT